LAALTARALTTLEPSCFQQLWKQDQFSTLLGECTSTHQTKKKGGKNPLHIAIDHQTTTKTKQQNKTKPGQNKTAKSNRRQQKFWKREKLTFVEIHE